MPNAVTAQGGNYLNPDIADVTISTLAFKSGVKGHIFVSWLHPNKEQKLVIVGDKKMSEAEIGDRCNIRQNVVISTRVKIGMSKSRIIFRSMKGLYN